ncbi:MAG: hypothetical protein ACHQ0J_14710 [Candidatus Dormibacterales bacterium]
MASELKPENIDFGVVIAFIAPGFVAFKALSSVSSMAADWLNTAAHQEQSLGVFLFVGLGSLSLGLAVSGVRGLVVDSVFFRLLGARQPPVNWKEVKNTTNLIMVRDAYYRYFQFYGNVAVAMALLLVAFWSSTSCRLLCAGVLAVVVLLASAYYSLHGYIDALDDQGVLRKRNS